MVHVDDIHGRPIISARNSPHGAQSVGHMRLSARLYDDPKRAETIWRQLEQDPLVPVHQTFDWCRAWAGRPGIASFVIVVSLDGLPAVLLPIEVVRRAGFRVAQFIGTAHSNCNSPIYSQAFRDQADAEIMAGLSDTLQALPLPADILVLDKLRAGAGERAQPLLTLPHVANQNDTFQLPLKGSMAATLQQINAKRRRKKMRVSERRLAEIGGYRHLIADDAATATRLLDTFFEQKAVRLSRRGLRDVFADAGVQTALRRLTAVQNGHQPPLQLHAIALGESGGGPILAVAGLTEKDGHVICQFGSVDDMTSPDVSAGELLFYRMIEQAAEAGHRVFDFGIGDQRYKRSWCPQTTGQADVFIALNARGRLASALFGAKVRGKRLIKTTPALHWIAAKLRSATLRLKPNGADPNA
ncbi:GNAT family N-acetyltransferase [Pseudohoeflea coraliihabitans]|uniref:GNAT family N-acetyltransferase n=1 Tax=Pseudohoeflea coraliihabitans TaxID=2860393 RepID=A0ABS6WS50_9HYPH|nr:GNAT family N-acetyltransferase [Pseudohoeflea sp. DP4N28-3]MBW3098792.1 GNAT family N-acetyltransferase [Pseudohoeflea sp. DP4N28-3]